MMHNCVLSKGKQLFPKYRYYPILPYTTIIYPIYRWYMLVSQVPSQLFPLLTDHWDLAKLQRHHVTPDTSRMARLVVLRYALRAAGYFLNPAMGREDSNFCRNVVSSWRKEKFQSWFFCGASKIIDGEEPAKYHWSLVVSPFWSLSLSP